MISMTTLKTKRTKPGRSVWLKSRATKPRIFGKIKIPIVPANTNAARYGSSVGHCGKSENPGAKYSGRMKCACSEISTPRRRKPSHIGAVT